MAEFPGIRKILIPVDFSEAVPSLVHYAMELVRGRGAHVVLLHVVGPPVALVDPMQGSLMDPRVLTDLVDRARERLEGIAAGLAGLTVEAKVLVGSPARTIVEEAEPGPAAAEAPPPRPRTVHAERRAGKSG